MEWIPEGGSNLSCYPHLDFIFIYYYKGAISDFWIYLKHNTQLLVTVNVVSNIHFCHKLECIFRLLDNMINHALIQFFRVAYILDYIFMFCFCFFCFRVESILRKFQSRLPVLSDGERDMQKELKSMEGQMKHFKNSLEQVSLPTT